MKIIHPYEILYPEYAPPKEKRERKYDVVIIGGGPNGMCAAAYLAKAGLKVDILADEHTVPGLVAAIEQYFK